MHNTRRLVHKYTLQKTAANMRSNVLLSFIIFFFPLDPQKPDDVHASTWHYSTGEQTFRTAHNVPRGLVTRLYTYTAKTLWYL